jgi:hypothetical protein
MKNSFKEFNVNFADFSEIFSNLPNVKMEKLPNVKIAKGGGGTHWCL